VIISWSHLSYLCHLWNIIGYLIIPTHLSGWKEQNVMECRIERMHLRYTLKWLSLSAMEDDVSTIGKLLPSARYHSCDLSSDCGKVVSTTISARLITKSNPALTFWGHVPGQLHCRLVQRNSIVMAIQHVLKISHDPSVETCVVLVGHAVVESILRVIYIELRIDRRCIGGRKKRASTMREGAMNLEDIWTSTTHILQLATHRGHCQGIIILPDVLAKLLLPLILASKEMVQLRWRWIQSRKPDLATETAPAKFGIAFGGMRETFFHPMQRMTIWTFQIHGTHVVDWPIGRKKSAGDGKILRRSRWW
jgi:hypothetical protein